MASSFYNQIHGIVHLITKLKPKSVLDIGKGFGNYGFLIHEYVEIDNRNKINPLLSLKDQSTVTIDAVEIHPDLMMPHLSHIYRNVFFGDVTKMYPTLNGYDLILMVDIIEHINKEEGIKLLRHFLNENANIIIATPRKFFQQKLYQSEFEHHLSHWKKSDFSKLANVQYQYFDAGAVFLLSKGKSDIRGFGNSYIKKNKKISPRLCY